MRVEKKKFQTKREKLLSDCRLAPVSPGFHPCVVMYAPSSHWTIVLGWGFRNMTMTTLAGTWTGLAQEYYTTTVYCISSRAQKQLTDFKYSINQQALSIIPLVVSRKYLALGSGLFWQSPKTQNCCWGEWVLSITVKKPWVGKGKLRRENK